MLQRIQFGHPIFAIQAVQHMLADMAIQVEAARALGIDTQGKSENELKKEIAEKVA